MTKQELNDIKKRLIIVINSALAKHRAKVDKADEVDGKKGKGITSNGARIFIENNKTIKDAI